MGPLAGVLGSAGSALGSVGSTVGSGIGAAGKSLSSLVPDAAGASGVTGSGQVTGAGELANPGTIPTIKKVGAMSEPQPGSSLGSASESMMSPKSIKMPEGASSPVTTPMSSTGPARASTPSLFDKYGATSMDLASQSLGNQGSAPATSDFQRRDISQPVQDMSGKSQSFDKFKQIMDFLKSQQGQR